MGHLENNNQEIIWQWKSSLYVYNFPFLQNIKKKYKYSYVDTLLQ